MVTTASLLRFEAATRGKAKAVPVQFSDDAVTKAKGMLAILAEQSPDLKVRKDAAAFIVQAQIDARKLVYQGADSALDELAGLPIEEQRSALLMLFGRGLITRDDLDTVLKVINSAEAAKIAALEVHNAGLVKRIVEQDERIRDLASRTTAPATDLVGYRETRIDTEVVTPPPPVARVN